MSSWNSAKISRIFAQTLSFAGLFGLSVACNTNHVSEEKGTLSDRGNESARELSAALSPRGASTEEETLSRKSEADVSPQARLEAETENCKKRIELVRAQDAFPGAPRIEASRARLLARAKAEPVLFLREPVFDSHVTRGIALHQNRLKTTPHPREILLGLLKQYAHMRELRHLVLREGYLYMDEPAAARELSVRVHLERLFTEPALVLERGSVRAELERDASGIYRYVGGEHRGERPGLLLFDRVWVKGEDPGPSFHLDLRELAHQEGFEGVRVEHLGQSGLVVELRYEDEWVRALLERQETHVSLGCLLIEPEAAERVSRAREESRRRAAVLRVLRQAIVEQVQAGLPFDEPKTERGQQDGELRARWESAYLAGKQEYTFNGDKYQVFDKSGSPLTPQVCVDFVTETLERASGMRFVPKDQSPQKLVGALDFDELLGGQRRREIAFRQFARENPHRFSLKDYPVSSWVRYENVSKFFRFLEDNKDDLRSGDVVIIRGRAAWDFYRELHTHTFFIYESDPVTGMPLLLAGNAGKPRIVTWDGEMMRSPRRSVQHRVRPNMDWLYEHVVLKEPLRGERWATPLVVYEQSGG